MKKNTNVVKVENEVKSLIGETNEVINEVSLDKETNKQTKKISLVKKTDKVVDKTIKEIDFTNFEKFEKDDKTYYYNFESKELYINNIKQIIKSKSDMFRIMYNEGCEVCEVAKLAKSHYSFVYEVISKSNGQVRNVVKDSKSDEFRKLFDDGLTIGVIAKQTNSNYSFVHTCIKKYKESKLVVNN